VLEYGIKIPGFLGVFMVDDLPKINIVKHDISFVVIHHEHAIAVYITENEIDILDPLGPGNFTTFGPLCEFLGTHLPCKLLRMNTKIQSNTSDKCAKFCLTFLFLRRDGESFYESVAKLNCDKPDSDKTVDFLFDQIFTVHSNRHH